MLKPEDYNCKEQGECYLTYRKRMKREQREFEHRRSIKQTNQEWLNELKVYTEIYAAGLHRRSGETTAELKTRFESFKARSLERNNRC